MKVSLYKGDFSTQKNIELTSLAELIRVEDPKKRIADLRAELKESAPGVSYVICKKIPFIVFGATFRKVNGAQIMTEYNGLVLLEINNLADINEAALLRNRAAELLSTVVAFVGSSGKSVKILVSFVLPDGSLPQTHEQAELFHAHAYRRSASYYQAELKRRITPKPPLLQNGCRVSFDPKLFFNPAALPIHLEQPLKMPEEFTWEETQQMESDTYLRMLPGMERSMIISLLFETSLNNAIEATGGIKEDDPVPFLMRLAENCFRSGVPEEDVIKWISVHTDLRKHEILLRTTINNTYQLMKGFGHKPCIPAVQTMIIKTEEFMQRRYEIRRNEMKGIVEFRERDSFYFNFFPVTDLSLNGMCINAHKEGLDLWDKDVRRYIYSDKIRAFNPVEYYLNQLPVWDGTDRISALADTIPLQNPKVWRKQFRTWLLGMVAHWKQSNQAHASSVLPLLIGDQGCGKSTWCRNLVPPALQEYYTDSLDFSNKRHAEQYLGRFLLINLDEFDSINVSQQAFLKHLLQKPVVNARQAYKSNIQAQKRYAAFIATCNNTDLLTDPTGSRRFICIEITGRIKQDYKIDHAQLYAQALAGLRSGERYWFDVKDEAVITRNNNQFQQMPLEEQLFLQYFRAAKNGEAYEELSAIEIIQYIQKRSKIKLANTRITVFGRILRRNNIPKKHLLRGNIYQVVKIVQ